MAETARTDSQESRQVDEIFALQLSDFPRALRLKQEMAGARQTVAHERSKLLTDYFEKNGFDLEHPLLRQADSLKYVLENTNPVIFPDELIVGSVTEHRHGAVMFPEFQAAVIWPEMLSLPFRKHNPVNVSKEAVEDFSFRIFPYFKDKNIHQWAKVHYGYPEGLKVMEKFVFYLIAHANGVSHLIPNYRVAPEIGFNRIMEDARKRRDAITGTDKAAQLKREFYEAVIIVSEGVLAFAKNYSRKAGELADAEQDPERKQELAELSRMLAKVPAEPAETFREAMESMWITHAAVLQENSDLAVSFGRMDQFMLPYFLRDLEKGIIDFKKAMDIALCLYIKTNDHTPLVPSAGESLFSGSATNQSITLSGLTPDGKDGTNALSYLFLRALDLLRQREPNVDCRFHDHSPELWRQKCLEVIKSTGAAPALYNDEAVIPAMTAKGQSLADARDYGVIGCVETSVQGRTYPMTGSILLNLATTLELAIYDGVFPLSGRQIGPKTGWLKEFTNFDQLWRAFVAQLNHLVKGSVEAETLYERAHAELHPIPLLSAVLDGPMEKGKDATAGGAKYNSSGVWCVGLADVTDSLAAIKKLVFDEKRLTAAEMQAALEADFKGHETVHAMCLHRGPKYGNDEPEADELAVRIVQAVDQTYGLHRNFRKGVYHVGYWTMTMHTGYGRLISALPNGRKKGAALASGATPVSGAARKGPSAALSSTAKLPAACLANCIANNHKIPASILNEPGKLQVLEQLVKGFFRKRGMQIQFVIADQSLLIEAMNNPELAKDLLVRVSGYTAYFGDLNKDMQQEIINRTEDRI